MNLNFNVNYPILPNDDPAFLYIMLATFFIPIFIVHLAFAFAVAIDGSSLPGGRRPEFVGPTIWFLATLLGGPFIAGLYWMIHHSTICPFVYVACQPESPISPNSKSK